MNITNSKNINYLLSTLIAFFVVLTIYVSINSFNTLWGFSYGETERIIEVTGEGEVFAKPDLAVVSFSIENEEKNAEEALTENAKKTNAVIAYLKDSGIDEKDIKTTNFNLYPRYEYYDDDIYRMPNERRVLAGYVASQTLEVKIREMGEIGVFVEGGVKSGANNVSGIVFTIEDEKELKREARMIAIDMAKEEAKILAKQLNVGLSGIIDFTEQQDGGAIFMRSVGMEEMDKAMSDSISPEIATGENKIVSKISLRYKIR